MFKLEFDAANKPLAAAIGAALTAYSQGEDAKMREPAAVVEFTTAEAVEEFVEAVSDAGNDAESVTEAAISGATEASAPASAEVDENGVAKDPNFCATAAKPFYGSGKRKGQWKKRQGVDDVVYDTWYAQRLAGLAVATATEEPAPVDTAAAFGGAAATATAPAAEERTFKDAGEFMGWVSEQQTAGLLVEGDVTDAYRSCGVELPQLFNPQTAADAIARVYAKLADVVARAAA